MSTPSIKRTMKQKQRITNAESIGYKWCWDSEYVLRLGKGRYAARIESCISVLRGNTTGSDRSMVVYPDGQVTTAAWQSNGKVMFSRSRLADAMRRSLDPIDEDEHFMESKST